ncbi:MAG: DUF3048 domain-containing protein [Chloroflexi bacterium]|nr:DUF3048 domain-containing protein [Chloroflexota bacterium]
MLRRVPFLAICAALMLGGCGQSQSSTGVTASLGAHSLPAIQPPAYVPGPLDGQSTPRALALRRPLAVIVENYDPDSRPQSGLGAASMVIETLAESGITRFMAIYLEHEASKVGPVRSTRMYFNHWASAFHTILVHVGGNDDAQAELWHLPSVFNIDENRWEISLTNTGTPLFRRSSDRQAPHNMFVNTAIIRAYAARNRQNWAYSQAYILHKAAAPLKKRGKATTVSIGFVDPLAPQPNPGYAVQYRYDRASNTYLRYMGGTPHVDALTGRALRPANVIVVRTGNAVADPRAGITPESILIPTVATGPATYFFDGKVVAGTWQQKDMYAPLRFYNRRGRQVAFNPGQTWVEVVPRSSSFTWTAR